jgi:hypothetical protein
MTEAGGIKLKLRIDSNHQWFVYTWLVAWGKKIRVEFKVDTGCNAMVLSHRTLKNLGYSTREAELSKLPAIAGVLASGDKHMFRKLGMVSLFQDKHQAVQICKTGAICHATHETNDLFGTEVLRQFNSVTFSLIGDPYMELQSHTALSLHPHL